MFRKVNCPCCGNEMDEHKFECDLCHHKEEENKPFENISMVPFWKQALLFIIGCIGFQLLALIISVIVLAIAKAQLGVGTLAYYQFVDSYKYVGYVNFTTYFLIFAAVAALIIPNAHEVLRTFSKVKPLIAAFAGLLAILLFNLLYNTILNVAGVTISNNTNENTLNNIIYQYPLISILVFGILGPIVEELTYRVGLFSFFSRVNKILAYVITIVVFALIHFEFGSTTIVNELLNLPLYVFAGFVLSYLYDHYGFAGSVYCHVFNNVLSIVSTIIATRS